MADHCASECKQGLMDIIPSFESCSQFLPSMQPTDSSLDNPSNPTESLFGFNPSPSDARGDSPNPQGLSIGSGIVALVSVQYFGTTSRTTAFSPYFRHCINHRHSHFGIVRVRSRDCCRKRYPSSVNHDMMFRACFSSIGWVASRESPPFTALTLELSIAAQERTRRSPPRRRSSNAWWTRSQTPAFCQSRSRRQHVVPLPYPNSAGRSCQAIPVRKTKRMPVNTARSSRQVPPPRGWAGRSGSKGLMISHRSSGRIFFAIPLVYQHLLRLTDRGAVKWPLNTDPEAILGISDQEGRCSVSCSWC
jgi:hypothetical protein